MAHSAEFVIRPNTLYHARSWPWVFALLAVICLSIGLRFAWLGYWMILPFAVIDVVAVGIILYLFMRKGAYVEKIVINAESVIIRHVQQNNRQRWKLPLHWAQVRLEESAHRWYPRRLLLGCKGQWIEVGQCLTDDERETLGEAIRSQIIQFSRLTH